MIDGEVAVVATAVVATIDQSMVVRGRAEENRPTEDTAFVR